MGPLIERILLNKIPISPKSIIQVGCLVLYLCTQAIDPEAKAKAGKGGREGRLRAQSCSKFGFITTKALDPLYVLFCLSMLPETVSVYVQTWG